MKTAEKTLQKWMCRSVSQSLQYSFMTWKSVSDDMSSGRRRQLRVFGFINRIKLKMAWRQWTLAKQAEDHQMIEQLISQEEMGNGCVASSIETKRKEQGRVKDKTARSMANEQVQSDIAKKRNAEVLLQIIKLNDSNHFMSMRRAVFYNWREYIERRRRCCVLLSRAVFAMLAQRTFTEIKDFSRDRDYTRRLDAGSGKLFRGWSRCLCRRAFNKWRVSNFHLLKEQIADTKLLANGDKDKFERRLEKARGHFADVVFKRREKKNMQAWYDAIRQFAHN